MDLEQMKINKEKEIDEEKEKLNKKLAEEKEEARKEIEAEKTKAREEITNLKKSTEKEEEKKDPKKIVDNYLIGRKIKVVNSVETKKRRKKKTDDNENKIVLGNKNENINARLVIERPKAEDLPKIREMEKEVEVKEEKKKPTTIIDNRELNLKDNKVSKKKKKLSTSDIVLKELNTLNKKKDTDLLFNPKMVKKVDNNTKETGISKKEKKKGLIYIVKEKKDKK